MNGFEDGGDTPHSGPGDDGAPAGEPDPVLAQLMPPDPVDPVDPPGRRGFFSRRRNIAVVAGAAVLAVGGGIAIGVVVSAGSSNTTASAPSGFKGGKGRGALGAGESGSNARSVNEPGGTSGTVSSVSGTGFTVTGQGTIVGAATADQAVAAALAKYPGGLIDRVVQLSDGGYEVHDIGTTMHHIFEDSTFKVIGAN
ncbi:hypothetical protein [Streptacidiphilus jeojiense]|uniref:hypothetical protein n=1 Tax=Streptacidiphilus jeojiense TaxID=436229 RepID=UPI0004BF11C3|nr:hypothetical protein [Streptacidiphilus jeojiense]